MVSFSAVFLNISLRVRKTQGHTQKHRGIENNEVPAWFSFQTKTMRVQVFPPFVSRLPISNSPNQSSLGYLGLPALPPHKCRLVRFSKQNTLFSFNFEQTMISFQYLSIFRTKFSLKCTFHCACNIFLGNHLQSQDCFSNVLLSCPISHEPLEILSPPNDRIHISARTQSEAGAA